MAEKDEKWPENKKGKFYVDEQCIDCDLCRETAPDYFTRNEDGGILLLLMVMVTLIGISAGIAGSSWSTIMQRSNEEELLWRGEQYRKAIESYYTKAHTGKQGMFPSKLEYLLKDPRSLQTLPHIRKLYKDPITKEDFVLVKDAGGRIIGVKSSSGKKPFKQGNFPADYSTFAGKGKYSEWEFVYRPQKKSPPAKTGT
jgi:type II secretory pathway pseudopilin PulG